MPDTVRLIRNSATSFQKKNIKYISALTNGEVLFFSPSVMTLYPEGMSSEDIRHMSEDALLDMDYFLNEDDPFDDLLGEEGFYIF